MLLVSELDAQRTRENLVHGYCSMLGTGSYNGLILLGAMSDALSAPEITFTLFEDRLSVTELSRTAVLNRKLASGTALRRISPHCRYLSA
jgi:hypothetical protein